MASIFTYNPDPPPFISPWLHRANPPETPLHCGIEIDSTNTPGPLDDTSRLLSQSTRKGPSALNSTDEKTSQVQSVLTYFSSPSIPKLEAEPQSGPTEYKLHLLLRPRRKFLWSSTGLHISGSQHTNSFSSSAIREAPQPISNIGPRAATIPPQVESNYVPLSKSDTSGGIVAPKSLAAIKVSPSASLAPTIQQRQYRLQQLTTQLLWRLQQSSPHHPSSGTVVNTNASGETSCSARQLHALEESRGALYELGVSDDGSLIGLIEDEMEESLQNLRGMAASLGCRVQVLRIVAVGECEWLDKDLSQDGKFVGVAQVQHREKLWVAEAFIQPDARQVEITFTSGPQKICTPSFLWPPLQGGGSSSVESSARGSHYPDQLRISLIGASSGKSSLLGTICTSTLDNGRGKSRLSLLKSSVTHELIGYRINTAHAPRPSVEVINYSSGNVSSWTDIHALASDSGRLVFFSDPAGHPRYRKTTLRGLIGWSPHWTILCIAADGHEDVSKSITLDYRDGRQASKKDLPGAQLELCLMLKLPLIVCITKLDLASKTGLRRTLNSILSSVKRSGRKPALLSSSHEICPDSILHPDTPHIIQHSDENEVKSKILEEIRRDDFTSVVPIVFTSAVKGTGFGKLHALLHTLPIPPMLSPKTVPNTTGPEISSQPARLFHIEEVYSMHSDSPESASASHSHDIPKLPSESWILCGYLRYGRVSIGDELILGPFPVERPSKISKITLPKTYRSSDAPSTIESHQISWRNKIGINSNSAKGPPSLHHRPSLSNQPPPTDSKLSKNDTNDHAMNEWLPVRVISIRNLRLPLLYLLPGQVGTIGVAILGEKLRTTATNSAAEKKGSVPSIRGAHTRPKRGMILGSANSHFEGLESQLYHREVPVDNHCLRSCLVFTSQFLAKDLAGAISTKLIGPCGSHVIAYIASIRSSARVVSLDFGGDAIENWKRVEGGSFKPSQPGALSNQALGLGKYNDTVQQ
ncbi:MAG: hypothetical protein M1829_004619 [Trizodia sp. TS-e1964]|nr:MAG: hypothetical protein M1829_004619 [Trizodia sp. TS-e1964]